MKYKKIMTGFSSMSDSAAKQLAIDVETGCKDNPYFESITPLFNEFVTATDEFVNSIPARQLRNQVSSAVKQAKRDDFDLKIARYGYAVMSLAYGNNAAVESSGFKTTKAEKVHRPKPGLPVNVQVVIANEPNTIQVSCDANSDAAIYEVQIHNKEGVIVGSDASTSSSMMVAGILEGVEVNVKMRLKNSAGPGKWSKSVATRIPLPTELRVKFMDA